jgi:hypothetical protein
MVTRSTAMRKNGAGNGRTRAENALYASIGNAGLTRSQQLANPEAGQ